MCVCVTESLVSSLNNHKCPQNSKFSLFTKKAVVKFLILVIAFCSFVFFSFNITEVNIK